MDTVVTDFNTSHVSINRNRASGEWNHLHISIHLMFLLIPYVSVITGAASMYFNTSHVSINLSADDIV